MLGRQQLAKVGFIARANSGRASKDRRFLFSAAFLPIAIMLLVGTIFGGGNRKVPVGLIDRDGSVLSSALRLDLQHSARVKLRHYTKETSLRQDIRRGRVLAGVIVPWGYDRQLRAGERLALAVVSAPGRTEGIEARSGISESVTRQGTVIEAARLLSTSGGVSFETALARGQRFVAAKEAADSRHHIRSPFSYTAPSNLVLFVFITSLAGAIGLVQARELGVTRRMLATPTPPSVIVLGSAVTSLVLAAGQSAVLLVVGGALFGVHWGDPIALVLLVAALCVAATGAGLLLGTIVRHAEQAITIGPALGIALGMLGGCLWPLDSVGPLMRSVGHVAPQAWAMDGFIRLIYDGAGLARVGRDIAVLGLFAVALMALATWRLRESIIRAA
ncbi:MAG: linearmycin/streptolysin transport system permease protein [Actinomycetota bacterium]|jgi:ABC-2 type transport system permease protein|nr:linearmycin/streptolysin transport system permease protein [Actinomycetota bacterium]